MHMASRVLSTASSHPLAVRKPAIYRVGYGILLSKVTNHFFTMLVISVMSSKLYIQENIYHNILFLTATFKD